MWWIETGYLQLRSLRWFSKQLILSDERQSLKQLFHQSTHWKIQYVSLHLERYKQNSTLRAKVLPREVCSRPSVGETSPLTFGRRARNSEFCLYRFRSWNIQCSCVFSTLETFIHWSHCTHFVHNNPSSKKSTYTACIICAYVKPGRCKTQLKAGVLNLNISYVLLFVCKWHQQARYICHYSPLWAVRRVMTAICTDSELVSDIDTAAQVSVVSWGTTCAVTVNVV